MTRETMRRSHGEEDDGATTVSGLLFPPGFHPVRKKGEIEVWFLGRVIIPPVGR